MSWPGVATLSLATPGHPVRKAPLRRWMAGSEAGHDMVWVAVPQAHPLICLPYYIVVVLRKILDESPHAPAPPEQSGNAHPGDAVEERPVLGARDPGRLSRQEAP